MSTRYVKLLATIAFVAGMALPAGSLASWQGMGGTRLDSADVMSIAVKPGTDDVVIAATQDGMFWRWNSSAGDWDSLSTAGYSLYRCAITPDPLSPDSVFISYIRDDWAVKPARGATTTEDYVGTWLGPWDATDDTQWVMVTTEHLASIQVLSDGETLLAAGYEGIIYRSEDAGHSWYYDEGIQNNFSNELRDLVVVPGDGREFLVVSGNYLNDPTTPMKATRASYTGASYPAWVIDYTNGGSWIACTDSVTTDADGYDLFYDSATGAVILAAYGRSWVSHVLELPTLYDWHSEMGGPMKWHTDADREYYYPRAYAKDGTDIVVVTSYGAIRAVNHGLGMVVDISEGLPQYLEPVVAMGATKLLVASRWTEGGPGSVWSTDLTGGTPTTSISGHIEINGARPPVGTLAAAWEKSNWMQTDPDVAAFTDEDGNYVIDGLVAGQYAVMFFGQESYPGGIYTGEPGLPTDFLSQPTPIPVDGVNPVTGIDYIWDGAPEWGRFNGDDQSQAIPISVGHSVQATINSPNYMDYDWYYVPLAAGEAVIIDVVPDPIGLFPPMIQFYDGSNIYGGESQYLGQYGAGGGGLSTAHIGAVSPDDRGLWFRILDYQTWDKPADGSFNHRYTVTVSEAPGVETEPANNDTLTATPLPEGAEVVGFVHQPIDQTDYYRIDVAQSSAVWVEVTFAEYLYNLNISLLDANGYGYEGGSVTTSYASSWRFDGVLGAGTYFLRIEDGGLWANYIIKRGGDPTEPNDSWDDATQIAYGESFTGMSLGSTDDRDYYMFAGMTGDIIAVTIQPRDAEGEHPMVELWDDDESFYRRGVLSDQIGSPAYEKSRGPVRLIATLPHAGQYFVNVGPDYNWYSYDPMQGAGAQYDIRLDLLSGPVAGASEASDLWSYPYANIFAADLTLDAQGNTHYVWSDMGEYYGDGLIQPKPTREGQMPGGAIFYAKRAPDGTVLVAPTPLMPAFMWFMGGTKPSREAIQQEGGARPTIGIDPAGNVRISWLAVGYLYNEALNVVHLWFDPSIAADDGSPLYDMDNGGPFGESGIHFSIPVLDNLNDQPWSYYSSWGESGVRQVFGPDGTIYLVWDQEWAIRCLRLTPSGTAIGEPIQVASFSSGGHKAPDAALDGSGRLHVVWTTAWESIRYAMLDFSRENPRVIPAVALGANYGSVWGPSVVCDAAGNVHVAWTGTTEELDELNVRKGEVRYTQLNPALAPLNGQYVDPSRFTVVPPRRITGTVDWPSVHPNLVVGGDGVVYLSWHEWGHGQEYYATKPASGINDDGPQVVGIHIGRLSSAGELVGSPVIADAQVPWHSWKMDPSPVVVGTDGVAHLAWPTEYVQQYDPEMGYYYTSNSIRTQTIPVGDIMGPYVELVGYHRFSRQLNRAAPGDTVRFVVFARDLAGPVDAASVYVSFDPTVVIPPGSPGEWTFLVGSAFPPGEFLVSNVEGGNLLSIDAASAAGVVVNDTLFVIRMVVAPDAPLLTQSPLMFVYDIENNRRTLINEDKPGFIGAVLTVGVLGDVSGDSHVSAVDASLVLQHLVGLRDIGSLPGLVAAISDVSGRMGVTAYDASLILRYVLGTIEFFPVEGMTGVPRPAAGAGLAYSARLGMPRLEGGRFVLPISVDHRAGIQAGLVRLRLPEQIGAVESISTGDGNGLVTYRRDGDYVVIAFADPSLDSEAAGDVLEVVIRATGTLSEPISLTSVAFNEGEGTVTLEGAETSLAGALPQALELGHNAPNPFNPTTTIPYAVPYRTETGLQATRTSLVVYSVTGQTVTMLVDGELTPGRYQTTWDGTDRLGRPVGAGVYLAVLRAGNEMKVQRMVLLR